MDVDRLTEEEQKFFHLARNLGFEVLRGGYPDFALTSPKIGPFFVEVKTGNSYPVLHQRDMMNFLAKAGIPSYVSRDGDFPRLDTPYIPVNEREPRCELCTINTRYEKEKQKLDEHYRRKWEAAKAATITRVENKVRRLEERLETATTRNHDLVKALSILLQQLKQFEESAKEIIKVGT